MQIKTEFAPPEGPWSFNTAVSPGRGLFMHNDFGAWKDDFAYSDLALSVHGIPSEAAAKSKSGDTVASAKVLRLIGDEKEGDLVGIEVLETHFTKGEKVSFRCVSQFEFPTGLKRFEKTLAGTKEKEYSPTWPLVKAY